MNANIEKEIIARDGASLDVRQAQVQAEGRSTDLTSERENEACILRHQCDLKERVSALNQSIVLVKSEQDEVSIDDSGRDLNFMKL